MSHNLTLKACEFMLKDLEKQKNELDKKRKRLQIIIDKKRIQCGKSKTKSNSKSLPKTKSKSKSLPKSLPKTKSKSKTNSKSALNPRKSRSIKPSMPLQSHNFTSKDWEKHMSKSENKKQFQLSQLNSLPLENPQYMVDNNINKADLKIYMVDKKIPENMLHDMIERFKKYSDNYTGPRNKKGNITGYHKTNGLLYNAFKYYKKSHPMFNNMATGRL